MRKSWMRLLGSILIFLVSQSISSVNATDASPPQFTQKHSARLNHFHYLGDSVKFKCMAHGKPAPKVHWYRNNVYLNYSYLHHMPRYDENEDEMMLEIKNIELRDKGTWHCRVWNNEGSVTRNFTLHIIDFCDFILKANVSVSELPLSCVCQWKMLKVERNEVDMSIVTDDVCKYFKKENENVILHRRTPCVGTCQPPTLSNAPDVSTVLYDNVLKYKDIANLTDGVPPEVILSQVSPNMPSVSNSSALPLPQGSTESSSEANKPIIIGINAKIEDMKEILERRPSALSNHLDTVDEADETENEEPITESDHIPTENAEAESITENANVVADEPLPSDKPAEIRALLTEQPDDEHEVDGTTLTSDDKVETTTRAGYWPGPRKLTNLAPYFRKVNFHGTEPVISPAGRTVVLSCKASGLPPPQIIWRKNDRELNEDSQRNTGSPYRFKKYTLEMQDVVESDSGVYYCEVFNKHGTIRHDFEVRIVDRSRSKPVMVPNVLMNQTVNVNQTANFTCKVMSETLPHFTWAKLLNINGSYINNSNPDEPRFNLLDAYFIPRARVYRDHRITVLSIKDVTIEDQGIYSCIAGNSLGLTMANATLTVNEFRPMTLPTEQLNPPSNFQFIIFIALVCLVLVIIAAIITYILYQRRQAKNRIQNLDDIGVLKRVVIRKKEPKDGEHYADLAANFEITVENVFRKHDSDVEYTGPADQLLYEVPTDEQWEIDRNLLERLTKIGEGAFGEVYKCTLKKNKDSRHGDLVAVKMLKEQATDKELITLVSEMQIFKIIGKHKNVLSLIGCSTGLGPLYVILELCRYGNLRDFLKSHCRDNSTAPSIMERCKSEDNCTYVEPDQVTEETPLDESIYSKIESQELVIKQLTLRDLVRFSTEIARGMQFLAAKKILHRDLAARNVLVADNYTMKISDFGLSRNLDNQSKNYYRKHGQGTLPVKWMAPESLDIEKHLYTMHSDVWSYGVTIWEIMSLGDQPYNNIQVAGLYEYLMSGKRMDCPRNCPEEVYNVMQSCWKWSPEERPSFGVIADYFDELMTWGTRNTSSTPSESSKSSKAAPDTPTFDESLVYDTPRAFVTPKAAPGMESFESFVRNHAENVREETPNDDSPLLNNRKSQLKTRYNRNRKPHSDRFYFNMETIQSQETETEAESEPNASETSRRSSDVQTNLLRNVPPREHEYVTMPPEHDYVTMHPEHDYVNGSAAVASNTPPKSSKTSLNRMHGIRNSHHSDSSTMDIELGAVVYSNTPSKKSSASNLSVHPTASASRTSSRNGFIQRSYSTESQTSSGRGGSSAMSSAEGLGGIGDLCQIEYTTLTTQPPPNNIAPMPTATPSTGLRSTSSKKSLNSIKR
uniref:receptor protein-tyrosine kinase n=1 Tax=Panagrellus redivivus TaxID=6233 RepID=A0A7E4UST1_PANRE